MHESRAEHREGGGDGSVHRGGGAGPGRPHPLRHHPPPLRQAEGPGGDLPGAAVRRLHRGRAAGRHHREADAGGGLVPLPPAHHRVALARGRPDPGHVPDAGPGLRGSHLLLLHRGQEHPDRPGPLHLLPVRTGAEGLRVRARGDPRARGAARGNREGVPGVGRGAAPDPVPGGAGHVPEDPRPGAPGPGHQDPQRLGVHQEPVQPDVRGQRAAAAVAGGPAGPEPDQRAGPAAGEGEAAAGAGCSLSRGALDLQDSVFHLLLLQDLILLDFLFLEDSVDLVILDFMSLQDSVWLLDFLFLQDLIWFLDFVSGLCAHPGPRGLPVSVELCWN